MKPYKPSEKALVQLNRVHFVAIVGPTAVGKTTLIARVMTRDHSVRELLSTTSRLPRPGEVDGVNMHFRSREAMEQRMAAGEYVTAVTAFGELYATAPEDYHTAGVCVMPTLASIVPTLRQLPLARFQTVAILPPSYEAWQIRLGQRVMMPEKMAQRMAEAAVSLRFAVESPDVLFVLNDDLDVGAEALLALLHHTAPDSWQQAECRQLAASLLTKITS